MSTPATPGRIFISYRQQETAYPAGWLYDRLADRFGEDQVFKDVDSIAPGDDFIEVITRAVGSCDVLLALISDRWLTIADEDGRRRLDNPDDFVRLEIAAALMRNVRVIPILVDGAQMPRTSELPPTLAALVRRQALELSPNRFTFDTNRLFKVLDQTIAEVRRAQKSASSIIAADANPAVASKLAPGGNPGHHQDIKPVQRPAIVPGPVAATGDRTRSETAKQRRRPTTKTWSLAGLAVGVVLIPLLIVAAVATNSNSTTPSTLQPTKPKAVNVASLNDLVADFRKLGFTRTGVNQAFNLGSLPSHYDSTHRRYLQGLGLQRAVASFLRTRPVAILLRFGSLSFNHRLRRPRDSASSAYVSPTPQN